MLYVGIVVLMIAILFVIDFIRIRHLSHEINPITYTYNIPNIIFRTTNNFTVSKYMFDSCHKKWLELNPYYTMVWYTNKNCDEFMNKYYQGSVYDTYKILKPGAYKADLWRLCILYKFGGIYIDAYTEPFVSIQEMLRGCYNKYGKQFISVLDSKQSGGGIHNGFIVSERKHPFLKQAIDDIIQNVKNRYYGNSSLSITGPIALSKSIYTLAKKHHKIGWNHCGELSYYLYEFEWGPYQNIYKNGLKIFCKYFSFLFFLYHKNYSKGGYADMWKNHDIYN